MTTLFEQLSPDELEEVQKRIGGMILMLPVVSGHLGHSSASATVCGNYVAFDGEESRAHRVAKEFVNDLFKLTTTKMCRKWFGDSDGRTVRRCLRVIA